MPYKLNPLGPGLWTVDGPFRLLGIDFGNRMTIMQHAQGLALVSPLPFNQELLTAIQTHGTITHLIAPNREHNLYIQDWKNHLPDAQLWAPPGAKKLTADHLLLPDKPIVLQGIASIPVLGMPRLKEWAFVHHASATLVLTDLAFNFKNIPGFFSRLAFTLYGAYGKFGPTYLVRFLIRDKTQFRHSLQRVLQHPIKKIVVAHGEVVTENGAEVLKAAFNNYLL